MKEGFYLKTEEKVVFELREIYGKFGYLPYKMNKFEEYDLYSQNKDFLVSNNVITFTDGGKLMALKPDVTLSIIKNAKEGESKKVYYNENVYRYSKNTDSFKEIMQAGLECIGDIDEYSVFEVLYLAGLSLNSISSDFTLAVSDVKIINDVIKMAELSEKGKKVVQSAFSSKNIDDIISVFEKENADKKYLNALIELCSTFGEADTVKSKLLSLDLGSEFNADLNSFISLIEGLNATELGSNVKIDFSVINDAEYYNGTVFSGYVSGIATAVLSGGRYDNLMKRMNKNSGAIGFAVYLDQIVNFGEKNVLEVDVLLVYNSKTCLSTVKKEVLSLVSKGKKVFATTDKNCQVRYREIKEVK